MIINSLDEMESIVSKNNRLFWDGWTVVYQHPNPLGWKHANGAYIDGKWFNLNRYDPGPKGWDVPERFARYAVGRKRLEK